MKFLISSKNLFLSLLVALGVPFTAHASDYQGCGRITAIENVSSAEAILRSDVSTISGWYIKLSGNADFTVTDRKILTLAKRALQSGSKLCVWAEAEVNGASLDAVRVGSALLESGLYAGNENSCLLEVAVGNDGNIYIEPRLQSHRTCSVEGTLTFMPTAESDTYEATYKNGQTFKLKIINRTSFLQGHHLMTFDP